MALGRARLAMAAGISVWVLEAPDGFGDADFHAHHAIQLTTVLSGTLMLETTETRLSGAALAVAADVRHRFQASGLLAFVFIEPEGRFGRALDDTIFAANPLVTLDAARLLPALAPLASTFEHDLGQNALLAAGYAAIESIVPPIEARLPDPRIVRLISCLSDNLDQPLDQAAQAAGVFLSPSRLRHLFVEQTGLPFKTYKLWARLVRALDVYATGRSLTEAAHAAGFSDSAHLSRIFRRTFGLPATTLARL